MRKTFWALLALALAGCARDLDSTPEGAVTALIEALAQAEHDGSARADAYELLDDDTQRVLTARARAATGFGGREVAPFEMLVEGRSPIRFTPRRGGLRTRWVDAEHAVVVVSGETGQRAEVRTVLQQGRWRVVAETSLQEPPRDLE